MTGTIPFVSQRGLHAPPEPIAIYARPRAVVVGLDCTTGLQTARILSDRGVPVIGIARDLRHPCARTTVCERTVAADTAGPELIAVLRRLGEELHAVSVLFPCTDMSVLLASRHRGALADWFHVVLPDPEVVELLVDKARFYEFAERARLPLPRSIVLRTVDDAARAADVLRFPVVLKPALKTPEWERQTEAKLYQVAVRDELVPLYERCSRWTDTLVAQEWIAGSDVDHYTCNVYFGRGGAPLVALTTRKLRQWPVVGGQACLSVEVRDEAVEATTIDVLRRVNHRGLGYLELKRDGRSGEYLIIEPNIGRPTGRSATAEAAGVELLYTMYCDALGWPLPESRAQAFRGVKWIYLRRDLQSGLYHWLRGELTLAELLASWRGPKVEALFSWRDPIPFWADLGRTVVVAAGRVVKRAGGRRPTSPAAASARGAP